MVSPSERPVLIETGNNDAMKSFRKLMNGFCKPGGMDDDSDDDHDNLMKGGKAGINDNAATIDDDEDDDDKTIPSIISSPISSAPGSSKKDTIDLDQHEAEEFEVPVITPEKQVDENVAVRDESTSNPTFARVLEVLVFISMLVVLVAFAAQRFETGAIFEIASRSPFAANTSKLQAVPLKEHKKRNKKRSESEL